MTWRPLQLNGLSFINPNGDPAFLEFQGGLNVICGSSNTGKSFIVEAIDFLLGAKGPLSNIPHRAGYDRGRLVLQTSNQEVFTLQRSTSGGDFSRFEGDRLLHDIDIKSGNILRSRHAHGKKDTLSTYLLSAIGLTDKYVQKNVNGETQSLSFRNLVSMVVVQENDIIKRISPFLSGQNLSKTSEYSAFKLLLTGVDDSALVNQASIKNEIAVMRQNNIAKVELIDELLEELQAELSGIGIDRTDAEARLLQLNLDSSSQHEILNQRQCELDSRISHRYEIMKRMEKLSNRIDEIEGLLERFELLRQHYRVDLDRLAAIEESGSLFVYLEEISCPLCGALPEEKHQVEVCDGDISSVIHAAIAEIAKVEKLSTELEQIIVDLGIESESLILEKQQLETDFQLLNQEIKSIASPLMDAQNTFGEIFRQSSELKRVVESFIRISQLQEKKASLYIGTEEPRKLVSQKVEVSTSVLFDFSRKVHDLLQAWNFPGSDQVYFDESSKDIVIGGQLRTNRGKGLRAITHAAMTIGLMEFCKERDLSHPGFVVLDSPLLAYYKPESSEDSLAGTDLKFRFYEYLANNHSDSQVIIVENEHPPFNVEEIIPSTTFTGSNEGRYGFFPIHGDL
jgi:hypothetical protein